MKRTNWDSSKGSQGTVLAVLEDMLRLQRGLAQDFNTQGRLRKTYRNWGQSKARSPCFCGSKFLNSSNIVPFRYLAHIAFVSILYISAYVYQTFLLIQVGYDFL